MAPGSSRGRWGSGADGNGEQLGLLMEHLGSNWNYQTGSAHHRSTIELQSLLQLLRYRSTIALPLLHNRSTIALQTATIALQLLLVAHMLEIWEHLQKRTFYSV